MGRELSGVLPDRQPDYRALIAFVPEACLSFSRFMGFLALIPHLTD